ncbi:hypothetical protein LY78DRAFT_485709 [Colletotrichum sublineola]|nr:hypothetical protein LY78DRAFT_485709 [Colletotrichum sublineola]
MHRRFAGGRNKPLRVACPPTVQPWEPCLSLLSTFASNGTASRYPKCRISGVLHQSARSRGQKASGWPETCSRRQVEDKEARRQVPRSTGTVYPKLIRQVFQVLISKNREPSGFSCG